MQNRSSLTDARSLTLSPLSQTQTGAISKRHPDDLYRFRISDRSSFNAALKPLKANADVALLQDRDRNGRLDASDVITASTHLGTRKDKISAQLDKGTYYLRVSPGSAADTTKYKLDVESESMGLFQVKYFNNRSLAGKPTAIGYVGDGSLNLAIDWNANPPAQTSIDNFSARFTTQRNLPPGLYHVQVKSDDGVRVKVGKQMVIDQWVNQSAPHSGYFYSDGKSTLPIAIDYYNGVELASLQFSITRAVPFEDAADSLQQWKTTLFSWDNSQTDTPAIDFAKGGLGNKLAIGGINLGSNVRSDGKPGIAFNWGTGTYVSDGYRLPHDGFALQSTTAATFDGSQYKFRVSGDDGFQLLAQRQGGSKVYAITPKRKWVEGTQTQEFTYKLPAGQYDLTFNYFDRRDTASFDLSWETVPQTSPLQNPLQNPLPNPLPIPQPKPISNSLWDSPLHNYPITSPFGQRTYQNGSQQISGFHSGVDIGTGDEHPAVEAARKGTVKSAGMTDGGYGNLVEIDHGNGLETAYAHLDKITVRVGDRVDVDSVIGYAGATGNATGNHLHFEVRQNGEAQNPETFLNVA